MAANKGRTFLLKLVTVGSGVTFTVDVANDEIDDTGHGLTAGDQIVFSEGAAPEGLTEGRIYYVVGETVDTFQVAETSGGTAVTITGDAQAGCVYKVVSSIDTVAGCNANDLSVNNEIVDVTTKDDEGWRRLLAGISFRNVTMSATGRFQTAAGKTAVVNRIINGTINHYQVVMDDAARFEGAFQMSSLDISGPHDNVEEFNFGLESSGAVAFIAGS